MNRAGTGARASFRDLLKRYRVAAGLSQEALAERARLSTRGLSDLERGVNRAPHAETVARLAVALGLTPEERAEFEAAVDRRRGPPTTAGVTAPSPSPSPAHGATFPVPTSSLIGRAGDERAITRLVQHDDVRLLTLTGPGGVGKTRLAIEVAAGLTPRFADGAAFVSLDALRDPALVISAIAQVLGVREAGEQPLRESLIDYLVGRELLLVLDNFEHVAAAAVHVADLLAACPRLRLLVTSRAALHVRGEHEFPVAPLAVPEAEPDGVPPASAGAIASVAAVALFVQRAQAIKPDLQLTDDVAQTVAAICRRLDGLPLAIELAAVWIRLLTPAALLARLERRLPLLTEGARDLPERQRTLRDTMAWSYGLLRPGEQALFRRMAIFVGGCTQKALMAVCQLAADLDDNLLRWLTALVDHHLMLVAPGEPDEPRLTMLETVREYGLDRLAAQGEEPSVRRAHATYFLGLAEEAEPELQGAAQAIWLNRLAREHDNLRAALSWSLEAVERAEMGLRLSMALYRFWLVRGHLSEGRRWLQSVLAASPHAAPLLRARALNALGSLASEQGAIAEALAAYDESQSLFRQVEDWRVVTSVLINQGSAAKYQGDVARAQACYEEATRVVRNLGDEPALAIVLTNYGALHIERGAPEQAVPLLEESLALKRTLGNTRGICISLLNLAEAERLLGRLERAAVLLLEHRALAQALEDRASIALGCYNLGLMAQAQANHAHAAALFGESLSSERILGNKRNVAQCLEALAAVASEVGEMALGGRLFGAAGALRAAIQVPVTPADRADYERLEQKLRAALADAAEATLAAGGALPIDAAIDEALALAREYGDASANQ